MSCIQVTTCRLSSNVLNQYKADHAPAIQCIAPANILELRKYFLKPTISSSKQCKEFMKNYVKQRTGASNHRQLTPMCLFDGGKEKSDGGNEASPWKSIEKAMGGLKKEQSLEDVLRQQMQDEEYYDDEGGGGNPPSGGGGGRGSGSGSGGMEDENSLDEMLQVTLATIAVICVYFYILDGEDIRVNVKDIIIAALGGRKSVRYRRLLEALDEWGTMKVLYDPLWLDKKLLMTPTLFHRPKTRKKAKKLLPPPVDDYAFYNDGYDDKDFEIFDQ